jgi:hypothetical protein
MSGAISRDQFGRHFIDGGSQRYLFTIWTKMPDSKRGEYSEEVDVLAGSVGEARVIGNIVLKSDYVPELRITKITRVW